MKNWICLLAIVLSMTPAFADYSDTVKRSFDVEPGGTLMIDTDLGSIRIHTHNQDRVDVAIDRNVDGNERKVERTLEKLDIQYDQTGDNVQVRIEYEKGGWLDWGSPDLELDIAVTVPTRYNLDLNTSGGSIEVDDLEGTVQARTSGGRLNFGKITGSIQAKTSGGSITLEGGSGDMDVKTSGGSINIGDVQGTVRAKTSGGSINVEEVSGEINASTSGGSVSARITEQPQGNCSLKTSGGGITVHLAPDIRVTLDARTSGGGVSTDFPVTVQGELDDNSLQADINGGGPVLQLKTSGGRIRIHQL